MPRDVNMKLEFQNVLSSYTKNEEMPAFLKPWMTAARMLPLDIPVRASTHELALSCAYVGGDSRPGDVGQKGVVGHTQQWDGT